MTNARGSNQYQTKRKSMMKPYLYAYLVISLIIAMFGYADKVARGPHPRILSPIAYAAVLTPTVTPTPTPTHRDIILQAKHSDIILRIWTNESTQGRFPFLKCTRKGLISDMGYGVLNTPPICFKTFQDEVTTVDKWFDKVLKTHTLAEALTMYSGNTTGTYISSFINQ